MRRDAAWWGAVIVSMLTAGFLPAAAGAWASELIGRNATGVPPAGGRFGTGGVTFRWRTRRGRDIVLALWLLALQSERASW